ncbi:MAG: hypothetical protein R6V05_13710 [Candidatus Brocadiia bacterium]
MSEEQNEKTVLVLGAGFTKAFFPDAPLVEDYYDLSEVQDRVLGSSYGQAVLDAELAACGRQSEDGRHRVNLERLMTRLHTGMPYDKDMGAGRLLAGAFDAVKRAVTKAILNAGPDIMTRVMLNGQWTADRKREMLREKFQRVLDARATCVTFNYDDFTDRALWELSTKRKHDEPAWNAARGYGFPCPYWRGGHASGNRSDFLLLKLHGSINWRIRRGAQPPFRLDDLARDSCQRSRHGRGSYTPGYERESFIVPPVLAKADLLAEPVLQVVWYRAYQHLSKATRVIFFGYSLPPTDFAAQFLFREAIQDDCEVRVVNLAGDGDDEKKQAVMASYKAVFPRIPDDHFDFSGAADSPYWDLL